MRTKNSWILLGGRRIALAGLLAVALVAFLALRQVTEVLGRERGRSLAYLSSQQVAAQLQERYERLTAALIDAFAAVGIAAERGELAGEWCPGSWSVRAGGVKLAGLAQRAVKGGAWADAVVELAPDRARRELLAEVYAALELPLAPATLGSVSELAGREVGFDELAQPLLAALNA